MASRTEAKAATIVDVARVAAVSVSTASRALNGSAGVRPSLEQRVRAAALALGYRPNFSARSLRQSKTLSLGVIFNNLDSLTQLDLVRGLGAAVQESNYSLLVTNARYDRALYQELAVRMFERGIDGLFLSGPVELGDSLSCYAGANVPVIGFALNEPLERFGLPSVCTDESKAVQDVVGRLVELGHETALCILGRWESSRFRLVSEAFASYERTASVSYVEPGSLSEAAQVAGISKTTMLTPSRPTVLFTNQAFVAHLLPVLREQGIRVPEDLSVVAFGDSPWLKASSPTVSAIRSDIEEMGWLSGTLMIQALRSGEKPPEVTRIHQAEWLKRESVDLRFVQTASS